MKVRHSHCVIEALIPIWIITKMDGTINCAHCLGSKAGLAESCSHIASLLFYLDTWTKLYGRLSCTQMKCSSILPNFAKEVEYARVQDKSAKKSESWPWCNNREYLSNEHHSSAGTNVFTESPVQKPKVPVLTQVEVECFYSYLSKCKTKPVVLSLMLPYADSYVLLSRKIPSVMDL